MKACLKYCHTLFWSIYQIFRAARLECLLLVLFVVFQGLVPAASLYAIQGIIQWITEQSSFPAMFIGIWGGMLLVDLLLNPVISILRLQLNEKVLTSCNLLLMQKANTILGLEPFEKESTHNELQFLKQEAASKPMNLIYVCSGFLKSAIALSTIITVLWSVSWWIPLGLVLANFPYAISVLWFEKQSWDQMLFRSSDSRKLAWLSSLTLDTKLAKEVRLFNFGSFIEKRYQSLASSVQKNFAGIRWRKSFLCMLLSSCTAIANIIIISITLLFAREGSIPLSGLVIVIQALVLTQSQLSECVSFAGMMTPIHLFFSKLKVFLSESHCSLSKQSSVHRLDFEKEICFDNVSFTYPDGRKALENVSFSIKKGQKIAIVGHNGAGKSTLIKLLLRFYDPTNGRILVDGIDLRGIDIELWRSQISGVFQDFGQYHFTVAENISLSNTKASREMIERAAQKGGLSSTIFRLPQGLDSPLGKQFGGTELSGGEWQKLAMSRAFLPVSRLLVLDEPTSSLDPESEVEVFNRFSSATYGKTAFLVTHRLGSVKMADRILVLQAGKLLEEGSHEDLLARDGEYAKLFRLQAKQFDLAKSPVVYPT